MGEVNHRLKRPQDATAPESLKWLMREVRKHHTAVSLHINALDAYEDSPLWQEYLEKDIIAKDNWLAESSCSQRACLKHGRGRPGCVRNPRAARCSGCTPAEPYPQCRTQSMKGRAQPVICKINGGRTTNFSHRSHDTFGA